MDRNNLLAALQLLHTNGLGQKTFEKVIQKINSEKILLTDFVALSATEKVKTYGLKLNLAEAIQRTYDQAAKIADELIEKNISLLIKGDLNYPQKLSRLLGKNAPPFLFAKGDLTILDRKGVGFCGSRKASEKGLKVASDCADLLAQEGINIVSGYAHGVDLATHRGAMRAGGVTTLVLAEGILNFKPKREIAEWITSENHVIVSEFLPRLTWLARNAMQRNRTICGLSDAIVVIESGLKGGTFEAGNQALRLKLPLFVAEYANPASSAEGNQYFLKQGASAIRGNRAGNPNLTKVFQVLQVKPKHRVEPSPTRELSLDKISDLLDISSNAKSKDIHAVPIQLPMFPSNGSVESTVHHVSGSEPKIIASQVNDQQVSLTWHGFIPLDVWPAFYKNIIEKSMSRDNLKIKVTMEVSFENNQTSHESIDEIRLALRELNLDDRVDIK